MQWSDAIKEYIQLLTPVESSQALIERVIRLIDLTNLNEADTEEQVAFFLEKAQTTYGDVAAVCIYPPFVRMAAAQFAGSNIKVATVANFPDGSGKLESVLIEIGRAIQDGAQEVDVVFPYQRYLAGERQYAQSFVTACKAACGDHVTLKVILETGALVDTSIIADACYDAIAGGADFVKTSTGKIHEGATLAAAATILLVIKHVSSKLPRPIGLKVSGGIRDIAQAAQYIELAEHIMGREWVTSATFRIGASKLVDEMVKLN